MTAGAAPASTGAVRRPRWEMTPPLRDRKFADSSLEGTEFELPVRGRGQSGCHPFYAAKLGTGRCALSVFGQHDALHQSVIGA
jgi:hypothetical protein